VTATGAAALQLWLLPRDEARLGWYCRDGLSLLSSGERARVEQAASPVVARRFLLGRVLMRRALGAHLGVDPARLSIIPNRYGKPLLLEPACPGLAFSLAHSRSEWAFALAQGDGLGVDLEPLDRTRAIARIAGAFYSAAERRRLADEPAAALGLWTLKEAVVKAVGGTIWQGLGDVSLEIGTGRIAWLAPPPKGDEAAWFLALGRLRGDHWLALALLSPPRSAAGPAVCIHVLEDEDEGGSPFILQFRSRAVRRRSGAD
jgi:4'-phosphopantetheinyl transferase